MLRPPAVVTAIIPAVITAIVPALVIVLLVTGPSLPAAHVVLVGRVLRLLGPVPAVAAAMAAAAATSSASVGAAILLLPADAVRE